MGRVSDSMVYETSVNTQISLLSIQFTSDDFFPNRKVSGVILDYTTRELSLDPQPFRAGV